MKTLITGADGFIGGWLARFLLERGDEVYGLSRRAAAPDAATSAPSMRLVHADLRDEAALRAIALRVRPEAIFHLAALNHIPTSFQQPAETVAVNVTGTINLLEAARAAVPDAVFVSVGSSSEYGDAARTRPNVSEDDPLLPTSPYAVSKVSQALLCRVAFKAHGTKAIHARPFAVIGPGKRGDALTQFAEQVVRIERGEQKDLSAGNLEAVRDFIDVRDCARALALLAERAAGGTVYNVCNGTPTSLVELLDTLRQSARSAFDVVLDPSRMRPVDDVRIVGNPAKIAELGYQRKYTLAQTAADTLASLRERLSRISFEETFMSTALTRENLTVAMISRNEEGAIAKVVADIRKAAPEAEILLVDSSTDKTAEIAESLGARVIKQMPPKGYNAAMDLALRSAVGKVVVTIDCDDTYPAERIPEMARLVLDDGYDLVDASRLGSRPQEMPLINYVANWGFALGASVVFTQRLTDLHSGMRAYRKSMIDELEFDISGTALPVELLLLPIRRGYRTKVVFIDYRERVGVSKMRPLYSAWWTLRRIVSVRVAPTHGPGARA